MSAELLLGDFSDGEAIVIELFDPGLDFLFRGGWVGLSVGVRGGQQSQSKEHGRCAGVRIGDRPAESASGLSNEHKDRHVISMDFGLETPSWNVSQEWGCFAGVGRFAGVKWFRRTGSFYL